MITVLSFLFLLVVLAIGLWISWNVLEVIYRVVMITLCAMAYIALTIWEILASAVSR